MPSDNLPSPLPTVAQPKKPRRESRASLTSDGTEIPASHQSKASHHAASQSQDLTVFSDLTEPPEPLPQRDSKGLTADIQGGLSGLYNKFRASVGGARDADGLPKSTSTDTMVTDSTGPNATSVTSGKTSRVHSPRVTASDAPNKMEISLPKLSIRTAKLTLPSPGLRSPNTGPHPTYLADPTLTELHIHATGKTRARSRTGSSQGNEDLSERSALSTNDEQSLRRVLTKMDQEARVNRQDKRVQSPHPPHLAKIDTQKLGQSHSRGVSDSLNYEQRQNALIRHHPTPSSAIQDNPLTRVTSHRQDSPIEHRASINPLELLASHEHGISYADGAGPASKHPTRVISPLPSRPRDAAQKPVSRVSHSKLPGFAASRTSSTDSGRTSGTLAAGMKQNSQKDYPVISSRSHHKLRGRLLQKEYWMRDENARDCFRCSEPFTTFRRKHHCRACGQIFDNKCTTLISGTFFDMPSAVRVCKSCEQVITSHDDDSSEYSDDMTTADYSARPRTPDFSAARYDDDNISMVSQSLEHIARTPVMNLPVRRAFDKNNRSSAILEFDTPDHALNRPSSSRSLRTSHSMGHGHKRHPSKHSHIRSVKAYHDDRAPFQRRTVEDLKDQQTSAFHRDSVIDPELAQYLSDDPSSDEEPVLQPSSSSDKLSRSGPDSDRTTIGGLLAVMRKGRSRIGDRSIAGLLSFSRDADDAASVVSARAIDGHRGSRKRNLSVASSVHQRLTPRTTKERLHVVLPSAEPPTPSSPALRGSRMIRSASMHGSRAPSLELNRASIQHVHKLLRQLLTDINIPKASSWENALVPILLRATDDVDPNVQDGDDIDIRSYVKLKKIPGGKPADTSYTPGLIFTKNVALKSMQRTISRPRILIITFSLEYARSEAHFMSLDPVIRQEREYLENLVARIAALGPDVLLAQKHISGLALELLEKAGIAVVFKVKASVLEAVSRCTNTPIYHSIDKFTLAHEVLGTCEMFQVKTFLEDGRRKTYMYFSGCPPELGCTVALRGAARPVLEKIKRIADFMIYVVYNLKLETCLMRDEWALIPSGNEPARNSVATVSSNDQRKDDNTQVQSEAALAGPEATHRIGATEQEHESTTQADSAPVVKRLGTNDSSEIPEDMVPTFYQDLADKHDTRILSASPFVKFAQPYLLMKARELERRVAYLKRLSDKDLSDSVSLEEKTKAQKFTLITGEMIHASLEGASRRVREIVHAVHTAEYDKANYYYETQKRYWEMHLKENRNLFDPYAHQNIIVLFSVISTEKSTPCDGPELMAYNFYNEHEQDDNFTPDCTLGQFVEDLCYRADDSCMNGICTRRMHEHHRLYVHGEAQISIFVEPHPPKMRGLQDVILMWSTCKKCGMETTVAPMSPSTWRYSFAKYLELSIWSADLHARAGGCPHDLHRDHLRYFGFKGWAIRVHYDAIELLEVVVPRMRITWKVDNDLQFRNEEFRKHEQRTTRFMVSVKLRLKSINVEALLPENAEACRAEVERLLKQANDDHSMLIKMLQDQYTNSQYWEILPLNVAMIALQHKVADWDHIFAEFESDFLPSERDIRRLATLQLKRIFLDRDVSVTTLASADDDSPPSILNEKEMSPESLGVTRKLSLEKTQDVLQSVMEEQVGTSLHKAIDHDTSEPKSTSTPELPPQTVEEIRRTSADLQHLDLALPDPTPLTIAATVAVQAAPTPSLVSPEVVVDQASNEKPKSPDSVSLVSGEEEAHSRATQTDKSTSMQNKSQLPTPSQSTSRRGTISRPGSPMLVRAQSQPLGSLPSRKDFAPPPKQSTISAINAMNGFGSDRRNIELHQDSSNKRLTDRFGISTIKGQIAKGQSRIPRAVANRTESRVSNLAKHFEQLTREFEQARLRERRLKAQRNRRPQIYPLAAPTPTVEVYKTTKEAVNENDDSEILEYPVNEGVETSQPMAQGMAEVIEASPDHQAEEVAKAEDVEPNLHGQEAEVQHTSQAPSETDDKTDAEDENEDENEEEEEDDDDDDENVNTICLPDSPEDLLRLSQKDLEFEDLPKHEKTSLMKMLTTFWAERSSSGWAPLEYPFMSTAHLFDKCPVVVREDELSSVLAYALNSTDYHKQLQGILGSDSSGKPATATTDVPKKQDEDTITQALLYKPRSHLKYEFGHHSCKMLCKIFFAAQFDAIRQKCGVADRFVESLSRCMKFDSKGGKSRSLFLKTLDDRFVIKSLSPVETQSFIKLAPEYFSVMTETFFHELPSVIAKMIGFYQVVIKNPNTGNEHNYYLLVMENLFYDRVPTRIFDLKGSMRNRKITATGETNEVLLDENMVDYIYETPLFTREHSKRSLMNSIYNDTLFLARQNVMDYSLMIAMDEKRRELVVGIIDCIRTYTWDKKLESWIKDRGFVNTLINASGGLGGATSGKNHKPTVTSPNQYKKRFRESMMRYVLQAPSCWHQYRGPERSFGYSGWPKVERVIHPDPEREQYETGYREGEERESVS